MSPNTSGTKRGPVRMSQIFGQMLEECPHDIQVYGACVANIVGGVNRFACEQEFQKLKLCFQNTLKKTRRR